MRLLFVDRDRGSARELHSEFLDYRGVNWSLTHCLDRSTAVNKIEQDSYQCVLYYAHSSVEEAEFETSELLQSANCPPVIAIADRLTTSEQLLLIERGCDDCVSRTETNGSGIMRRLRMTETRSSVWSRQSKEIAGGNWADAADTLLDSLTSPVNGPSTAKAIQLTSRLTGEVLDRKLRIAHLMGETSLVPRDWRANELIDLIAIRDIRQLMEHCEENIRSFDAILVEQSVFEEAGSTDLLSIKSILPLLPGIVLTLEKSDFASLSYLERGYADCIVVDRTTAHGFATTLHKAVIRRRRELLESVSKQQVGPGIVDRRSSVRAGQFRRRHVRFLMQRPIVVVPVLTNGAPDIQGRCNAETMDISLGGIGVKLPQRDQLPSRNWIIGLEQADGSTGWVSAFLRRVNYAEDQLHVGLIFQNDADDLFHPANLWPSIDSRTSRFETRLSSNILDQWVELGILQRELVRRARVCPECEAVASIGTGCSQCGSFDLQFHDLIHHFACAHVSQTRNFENDDQLRCPKCLQTNLVAGADFELIRSQYSCQQCQYHGDVTADVGCCLNCQLRFPLEMGREVEIHGYHVERLDILALVDAAR